MTHKKRKRSEWKGFQKKNNKGETRATAVTSWKQEAFIFVFKANFKKFTF